MYLLPPYSRTAACTTSNEHSNLTTLHMAHRRIKLSASDSSLKTAALHIYCPCSCSSMNVLLCRNEGGTWDTPDAARLLMRTVAAQHAEALGDLPWAPLGSDTLLEGFRESANTVSALMKGAQQHGSMVVHSCKACPSAADGSSVRRCAARMLKGATLALQRALLRLILTWQCLLRWRSSGRCKLKQRCNPAATACIWTPLPIQMAKAANMSMRIASCMQVYLSDIMAPDIAPAVLTAKCNSCRSQSSLWWTTGMHCTGSRATTSGSSSSASTSCLHSCD